MCDGFIVLLCVVLVGVIEIYLYLMVDDEELCVVVDFSVVKCGYEV